MITKKEILIGSIEELTEYIDMNYIQPANKLLPGLHSNLLISKEGVTKQLSEIKSIGTISVVVTNDSKNLTLESLFVKII